MTRREGYRDSAPWAKVVSLIGLVYVVLNCLAVATSQAETTTAGPELCLLDQTNGFPVEQAARAFDGVANVQVQEDCTDHDNAVVVRVVIRDESWSGWYNGPHESRNGAALISLNVGQAFRLGPHGWEQVIVHEIGHALGLDHNDRADSTMNPIRYADHDGLTAYDVELLSGL